MTGAFDFWQWKQGIEATLLVQGLVGSGSEGVPGPQGPRGAPGPRGPAAVAIPYARHVWVSPSVGVDDSAPERGTLGSPFKTLQLASDYIGLPANAEDFNAPWVVHVLHAGPVDDGANCITLPSTRRLTIHAPGCTLPPLLMTADPARRFGSGLPVELHVHGNAGDTWFNQLLQGGVSPGVCRIGDGVNAITLRGEGTTPSTFILGMEHVDAAGLIFAQGRHNVASPMCFFRDCAFSGQGMWGDAGPTGPGTGFIVQAERCAFGALPYQVRVYVVTSLVNCLVACAITVEAPPDHAFRRGVNGCNFYGTSSWTGPAGSMVLDTVTNYFVKRNGAGVPATVKTLAYDGIP